MTKKDTLPYSKILLIDSAEIDSTSVGLIINGEAELHREDVRAQELPKLIDSLLHSNDLSPADIDAVALSKREGSMTAIRIGTAVANTLSWTNRLPIIEVNSDSIDSASKKIIEGEFDKVVKTSQPFS